MILEAIRRPVPGLRQVLADLSLVHVANAVIGFIFAASAPVAIMLGVGTSGGLTEAEMASWVFGTFFLNGLVTLPMSLIYRQPLVFFWTIPGIVLVGPALTHLSFAEVVGAYHVTGLLLLGLGVTGLVGRVAKLFPLPIVMGMVAGVFLKFGLDWIAALQTGFWIAAPMTAAFVILSINASIAKRIPPMIGVLVVGVITLAILGEGTAPDFGANVLARPILFVPEFSLQAMIELVIPLAVTVLAAQNAQGIAILTATNHNPPVNAITTACGIGALVAALVGTVSTCLTGPVNAIISSSGEPSKQYTAAIVIAFLALLFGLFAPVFTGMMLATPPAFIATLAGLVLLRVLQNAFIVSFQGKYTLGALISFLITLSGFSIYNIGAPFWGLLFGLIASRILERKDYAEV